MFEFKEVGANSIIIDKNMIKLGNGNQIYLDDGNIWILEMYEGKNEYKANGEDLFSVFDGFSVLEDAVSVGLRLNNRTYQSMRDLQIGIGWELPPISLAEEKEAEALRLSVTEEMKALVARFLENHLSPFPAEEYLPLIPNTTYDVLCNAYEGLRGMDMSTCAAPYMDLIVRNIIYGLYKQEWMMNRDLTAADVERVKNVYRQQCAEDEEIPTDEGADAFLMEHGFNGELYVCFNEFLDNEFLDEGYMKYLLPGPLFNYWKKLNGDNC